MRIKVIINGKLGGRRAQSLSHKISSLLGSTTTSITTTQFPGHARELARIACEEGFDTIIAGGGDGTVNEIVNGIVGCNIALGIIPIGTANDLARYHHIPLDLEAACEVIKQNHHRRLDAIRINDWHFLTVAGLGLPCGAVAKADYLRNHGALTRALTWLLGSKLYLVALALVYRRFTRQSINLHVRTTGSTWSGDAYSLIVANQPSLGRSFLVSPAATNDDGLLDLFAIKDTHNRRSLLRTVVSTVSRRYEDPRNVLRAQGAQATVTAAEPIPIFGDGDLHDSAKRFDFEVVPAAIDLIVPVKNGESPC
jgi:diacylglycerol kinase (ATP)